MRIQEGDFVVEFASSDKFVSVFRVDASVLGGKKVVGNFLEKKFKPERNTAFSYNELLDIGSLLLKIIASLK